jgi:hypothetical protein
MKTIISICIIIYIIISIITFSSCDDSLNIPDPVYHEGGIDTIYQRDSIVIYMGNNASGTTGDTFMVYSHPDDSVMYRFKLNRWSGCNENQFGMHCKLLIYSDSQLYSYSEIGFSNNTDTVIIQRIFVNSSKEIVTFKIILYSYKHTGCESYFKASDIIFISYK